MTKALSLKKRVKVRDYIHEIRGQRVVLDSDLASIYGAPTKAFNQAIQRNLSRFPRDFMFRLTASEFKILKSQIVTSSSWGGRRKLPEDDPPKKPVGFKTELES